MSGEWKRPAHNVLAAGYAPPERLREVEAERDRLAAKLAKAEVSALPDSAHLARRMEDIARKAEQAAAERDAALATIERVRELRNEWWGRATEATSPPSWRQVCRELRAILDGSADEQVGT